MSGIVVSIQRDAVHMLTDGLSVRECDMVVQAIVSKQFAVPGIRAVCGFRGCVMVERDIAVMLQRAALTSFDELMRDLPAMLEGLATRSVYWNAIPWTTYHGGVFDLFVAGWSETKGAAAFAISRARKDDGTWKTDIHESPAALYAPGDATIDALYLPLFGMVAASKNSPGIEKTLLEVMQQQRRSYPVGGIADLTTITETDTTTRRVAKWSDVVGTKIDHFSRFTLVDSPPIPLLEMPYLPPDPVMLISAGAVTAVAIQAGAIRSDNGTIGALGVQSFSIGDNAVVVPQVQTGAPFTGNNDFQIANDIYIGVDTTGLAGKPYTIFAMFTAGLGYVDPSNHSNQLTYLQIEGETVANIGGGVVSVFTTAAGAKTFTASGGYEVRHIQVLWVGEPQIIMGQHILSVFAVKR